MTRYVSAVRPPRRPYYCLNAGDGPLPASEQELLDSLLSSYHDMGALIWTLYIDHRNLADHTAEKLLEHMGCLKHLPYH
jgi:hypothetical protein